MSRIRIMTTLAMLVVFFFSSRRRHTRSKRDWSSDVCSSDLPYEQKTLRAAARITDRVEIGGRPFFVGRLAGRRVVMALTGIGLINARTTTTALVFSGVAGGVDERINDVLVPATWTYSSVGGAFAADARFLAAARAVARR